MIFSKFYKFKKIFGTGFIGIKIYNNTLDRDSFKSNNTSKVYLNATSTSRVPHISESRMDDERERISNCSDTESTGSIGQGTVAVKVDASNADVAKLLECPVCYDIVLPPIVLCTSGHSVCNPCRENLRTCPTCRGGFSKVRNRFAEDFLDRCSISCKYKENGCKAVLPGRCLAEHQAKCSNRPILCRECDREIPYNKFLDHLRLVEKLETQRATECSTGFEIEEEEVSRAEGERFSVWEPTWIHAHGHDFFCFLETAKNYWWIWVGGFATSDICDQFICSITVWNKEKETEMKYVGKIHSIRSTPEEVLNSGQCLIFLDVNLKNFIYKSGIDVLVRIDKEYQPPKTRKGTVVESPITLFGSKSTINNNNNNNINNNRELTSRANRVNRGGSSRNMSNGNDNNPLTNISDADASVASSADALELNEFFDGETI